MRSNQSRSVSLVLVPLSAFACLAGPSRPALALPAFEVVRRFERAPHPSSPLVLGSDGALYGTTRSGGPRGP